MTNPSSVTTNQNQYLESIPIVYDRFRTQQYDRLLPVHIFGTSSKGNSIYIKSLRILVDLGLPYARYKEYDPNFFLDVDYVILTHEHGDHLNPSTLLRILRSYPNVKFIIHPRMAKTIMGPSFAHRIKQEELAQYIREPDLRFITATHQELVTRDNVKVDFLPHLTRHGDITNIAIELTVPVFELHMLYSSDLDNLLPDESGLTDGLPHYTDNSFNLIFLEANYDEDILNEALRLNPNDPKAAGNLRHISEQAAWMYVNAYLSDDGYFIPLHASATFGTLIQRHHT